MRIAAASALAAVFVAGCPPPVDPLPDGPPDPHRFTSAECAIATTNPAALVEAGVGFGPFTPMTEAQTLPVVDVEGVSFAYFTVQVRFTALEAVCLQYRLDIADPDAPNEAVAFDRFVLDLEPAPSGGGQVVGLAAAIENPAQVSGRRALLVLDVADGQISGHSESFARFQ